MATAKLIWNLLDFLNFICLKHISRVFLLFCGIASYDSHPFNCDWNSYLNFVCIAVICLILPSNSLSSLSSSGNPAMYMLAPTSLFNNIFPEVGTLSGFYKIHNKLFKSLYTSILQFVYIQDALIIRIWWFYM